jgi:hypothetical protein
MLPQTTPEKLKAAIAEFDRNLRDTHDWQGWEDNRAHKYAIRYNSRLYPAKKIVSLATGNPVSHFSGGDGTNSFLRSYGFEVIRLRDQTGLPRLGGPGNVLRTPKPRTRGAVLGDKYREADEQAAVSDRDPFETDPEVVERGVRGHATTQNRLAEHLRSIGLDPRSPKTNEPNFDIAWKDGNRLFVGEVKSITANNVEKQLRLGLGQVLRYAYQLRGSEETVPVLIAERCPSDTSWEDLCTQLGVILVWPEVFGERICRSSAAAI